MGKATRSSFQCHYMLSLARLLTYDVSVIRQVFYRQMLLNGLMGELQTWSRVLLQRLLAAQLGKEFLAFLWNTNFHYCVHKFPPPTPILSQINPVPVLSPYFFKIHFTNILPSMSRYLSQPHGASSACGCNRRFPSMESSGKYIDHAVTVGDNVWSFSSRLRCKRTTLKMDGVGSSETIGTI